ncbi:MULTISPECIES: OmpA/MotB family protein [Thermoanaerobacterium]|uniref:OmpA/MotB domain-containing protein n=2 Tax=Thermoanaerobacterium TaxID=28895 RepID=W9E7Q7_9THEO|nr:MULTISPECIES: flagellar motor protein MotB [Thermoanaerobacterium]AFK87612.1 OmpA/MotB domain protein [Thermoanaerobacterium saccharolyticum JW/SL-YS485]ETO37547.1 OmpA/MotB domain-containing protein [Thermoanaerobacterium aotearoense SCUT27]
MIRHEDDEGKKENSERWLLTYSDMITLLMIFFIVLYTISTVNSQKFQQIAASLGKTFDGTNYVIGQQSGNSILDSIKTAGTNGTNDNSIASQLDKLIKQYNLQNMVTYKVDERGFVISLNDTLLFDTGSADVKPEQKETLIKIGNILKSMPNYIRVEGYTDNVPINNNQFHSNWELSVIRATNVVEILVNDVKMDPAKISAVGYGEYRPIVPNDSDKNRQLNRRVDIVIMNSDYNKWEPAQ